MIPMWPTIGQKPRAGAPDIVDCHGQSCDFEIWVKDRLGTSRVFRSMIILNIKCFPKGHHLTYAPSPIAQDLTPQRELLRLVVRGQDLSCDTELTRHE